MGQDVWTLNVLITYMTVHLFFAFSLFLLTMQICNYTAGLEIDLLRVLGSACGILL